MEGGVFPCSSSSPNEVLDSLWIPGSSSPHGSPAAAAAEFAKRGRETTSFDKEDDGGSEGYYETCFHQPGKKRRLTAEQVHFLEQSFEVENKLEPERKIQLAKELALQPRQVAIWFQNRRARYKTKQLEKEYGVLKSSYDQLKSNYDSLFKENQDLKNEVDLLTEKFLLKEKGKAESNVEPKKETDTINGVIKQEEDSSPVKSDVFDSESPHSHSPPVLLAPRDDSSHGFEREMSDFSQEEEDDHRFLQDPQIFPKLEDECYINGLSCSAGNLGFALEDQSTWFWTY